MTRYILAALLTLIAAGHASADYLLIVVNLNAKPPAKEGGNTGNALGIMGGPPQPGGFGGGVSGQPGGANIGVPPQAGGMGGGALGIRGGMGGALGIGGGMGGTMPGPKQPQPGEGDADESPDLIVAVVEVKSLSKESAKLFAEGKKEVKFEHKWGKAEFVTKTQSYEATLLEKSKGVLLPTVKERFAARKKEVLGDGKKPSTQVAITQVARFALELGLIDECAKVMDDLAESDKTNAAVKAYLAVKADLAKPLGKQDEASKLKAKLIESYKVSQTDKHHFALVHADTLTDAKPQLDQLENTFRAYYYWWALRGVALPVPQERLVSWQSEKPEDFTKLRTNLTASPLLADSFFARRESVSVFSAERADMPYVKLAAASKPVWDRGYDRNVLLKHDGFKGFPKSYKAAEKAQAAAGTEAKSARTLALLLKLMEHEWEQTAISHEASRQMLFATKQLPRNVQVPEWIQFGMGSFFETPLQSPWPSIGAANPYWLPRFKDLHSKKKFEASYELTLKKIVTDGYFREKPKGDKDEDKAKSKEANLRKARAAAWSLTYYLARSETNLPKLQHYFKELSKQPRDAELDEKTLWACFAKAFELDSDEKAKALANAWINYVTTETLEASAIHQKIRDFHTKMTTPTPAPKQGGGGNLGGGNLGGGNLGGNRGPYGGKG